MVVIPATPAEQDGWSGARRGSTVRASSEVPPIASATVGELT